MNDISKGLLIVMVIATIIWGTIGVIYYLEAYKTFMLEDISVPDWFVFLILLTGYLISVGIGFSILYEKKLWRI